MQDIKHSFSIPARLVPMNNFPAKHCWRSGNDTYFQVATKFIHMYDDGLIMTYSLCYGRWEGSVKLWSLKRSLLVLQRDHSAKESQRQQEKPPAAGNLLAPEQ